MRILNTIKSLMSSIMLSFIMLSLILLPYPKLNNAIAEGEPTYNQNEVLGMQNTFVDPNDCQTDALNDDGSAAVYKPGCEFNETLGQIRDDSNTRGQMSLGGAIEQFVMYSFAAATFKSLVFANTARSSADCPSNKNAYATVYTMNAASVLYILGEMKARASMRDAQEKAVAELAQFQTKAKLDESDKTIAELAREENQKQLDAYYALAKVYEDKIEGIKKKLRWSGAAEVGYLGALATELLLVQAQKRMCDVGWTTLTTAKTTNQTTISTMLAGASATAATVYGAPLCAAGAAAMGALTGVYSQHNIRQEAQAGINLGKHTASFVAKEGVKIPKFFKEVSGIFKGSGNLNTPGVTEVTNALDSATEYAKLAQNEAASKTDMTTLTTSFSTAAASCVSCPACAGVSATMASDSATRNAPIFCCGGDFLNPNGYSVGLPRVSVMDKRVDIKFKNTLKVVKGLLKGLLVNGEAAQLMKPAILNFMEQQYFAKNIDNQKMKPLTKARKIASFYTQLNDLDDNFGNYLTQIPGLEKKLNKILEIQEDKSSLEIMIGKLKSTLMADAYAADQPSFIETLGYTVLLAAASMVMAKFIVNNGLVKPKSRMITYGAMAAVNAGMMIFYNSKISANENERSIILHEAQRFANSYGIKSTYGENNTEGEEFNPGSTVNTDPYMDTTGEIACATPSKYGFKAAACPAIVPANPAQVPSFESPDKNDKGSLELSSLPALMNSAVMGAASGLEAKDPKKMGAALAGLNNKRNAIQKFVSIKVDEYDKNEAGNAPKNKKDKKPLSLKKAMAGFGQLFNGSNPGLPKTEGAPAIQTPLAKKEKVEKASEKTKMVAGIQPVALPTPKEQNFDFDRDIASDDFHSDLMSEAEISKTMKEVELEKNVVSQKASVSIFKLISNRYLRSYPVLLPRKKH